MTVRLCHGKLANGLAKTTDNSSIDFCQTLTCKATFLYTQTPRTLHWQKRALLRRSFEVHSVSTSQQDRDKLVVPWFPIYTEANTTAEYKQI